MIGSLEKPLVEMKNVKKLFQLERGKMLHAVDGISIDIRRNEIIGLVGESGCGKSTLGRVLAGLHEKSDGDVVFDGMKLPQSYGPQDFRRMSRKVQMIFQDPYSSLNPRMTVREIISEGPRLANLWTANEVTSRVAEWLELVGLHADQMSRYPHEFSGGQRQRIVIARALAMQPEFVICDEPISALDVSIQAQIVNLLGELKQKLGLTLLFIAHDLSMVRFISDRMAVMYLGTIVEQGASDDVFFRPLHPYTQLLIASNPEPDPESERQKPREALLGEISTPVSPGPGCRFASRCPIAQERCRVSKPELREVSRGHYVACHFVTP